MSTDIEPEPSRQPEAVGPTAAAAVADDFAYLSAGELARLIRARELSPVELVEHTLRRIEAVNGSLHAFLTVCAERALQEARRAEAVVVSGHRELGPLHGVPFSVKDLIDTKDVRTTFGSRLYEDNVPTEDALAVARLRDAGAILIGKTNTPEFGMLSETQNLLGEDGRNPWDLTRTPAGSSGGAAAAVAAGLGPLALGNDGVGSITAPSAMCGVVGLKPTTGRVPISPAPPGSRLFVAMGPMTRSVADAELMLSVISGHDQRDPISLREPIPGSLCEEQSTPLRVAWTLDLGHFPVDADITAACKEAVDALATLGWPVTEDCPAIANPFPTYLPLFMADAWLELGPLAERSPEHLHPEVLAGILPSREVSTGAYIHALNQLTVLKREIDDFFLDYDILALPATATTAFPIGQPPTRIGGRPVEPDWMTYMPFAAAWNMGDNPVASVPCRPTARGLPVGLLLVARVGREDLVLRAARALEQTCPWADRRPNNLFTETGAGDGARWA
ncbi:amidase [Rhodococcus sp. NPDC057014]|uniref:amidase n=1 Tax=Rhodococcus sp. NPDC057014 TaxID=3346000 RepID=UPI003639A613